MIIVQLKGGLGNQMFQYALGKKLSVLNNTDLRLDISYYERDIYKRSFELNKYNITGSLINLTDLPTEIKLIKKNNICSRLLTNRIYQNLFAGTKFIWEKDITFDPPVVKLKSPVYLSGYWQSEKYFKDIKEILQNEFSMKIPVSDTLRKLIENVKREISIAVHFRTHTINGGPVLDQSGKQIFNELSADYYNRAIEFIRQKIGPGFIIYAFSDNPDSYKNKLNPDLKTVFIPDFNLSAAEELLLMSNCRHNITANSTFSWWGAWLNIHRDKIVTAPGKWYSDEFMNSKTIDLIPKEWNRI